MTRVISGLPPPGNLGATGLTIGTYDGLHRGHQRVIRHLLDGAKGETKVLLTFDPHPRCVLDPPRCPLLITSVEERSWLAEQFGIDVVLVIPFTRELAQLSAEEFLSKVREGMDLRRLVVGHDFAMGRARRGDQAFLEKYSQRSGFALETVSPEKQDGEPISSSRIRQLIAEGRLEQARVLLGHDFFARSVVEHGRGTGRGLGYPTANLRIAPGKLLPPIGIYAVRVEGEGHLWKGALNLGYRPTFGGGQLTLEVYLLDFEGDLYGKTLTVWFVERLRDEERFASVAELTEQIGKDVEQARRILGR
jgi:riboflavin kinase/FMN adenylyltransferase